MRKPYIYIIMLSVLLLFLYSCNDEWKDELYTKMVSLKAPINNEEVSAVYLRYKPEGKVTYKLPVIVSGSLKNDKDLNVRIGVDNDTLGILNNSKYSTRTDLYYKQLPESFFELPSPTCFIPSGSNIETYDIDFKFVGLDLVEKWVLPLTILEDPSYTMNMHKGWRKALLRIFPFNDYSGNYSSTGVSIYFGKETDKPMNVGTRNTFVVDENKVFFYAGITEELSEDRGQYKVKVEFEAPETVGEDGTKKGKLTISAENPAIKFETLSDATYEVREEMDKVQPHLLHRYTTIYLKYKYVDYTSASVELPYRCEGSMIMERKINILIPDEDQAIQW